MKIELSNPATRFLTLSAIALTLAALPSRADWTTVRADGSVVTVPSNAKPGGNHTLQATNNANDYATDVTLDGDQGAQNVATYDGPGRAVSPRVQANRERNRQRNNSRRNGYRSPAAGLGYGSRLTYGAVPFYPGYNLPAYPYGVPYGGYGFGYPGVVAPGATIVLPQGPITAPIAPAPFPWVIPPTITSVPIGGTVTTPYGQTFSYGTTYPFGYQQGYGLSNGTIRQSRSGGGISISRSGVSASIGGSTTTTSTQTTIDADTSR